MINLNVLITGDDQYLQYGYTLAENLMAIHQEEPVKLNLFAASTELSEQTIQRFHHCFEGTRHSFWPIHIAKDHGYLQAYQQLHVGRWGENASLWTYAHTFLPDWVDKIIVIDLDVLILNPLTQHFAMNRSDEVAFEYFGFERKQVHAHTLSDQTERARQGGYGNSGFVKLYVDKMRQHISLASYQQSINQLLDLGPFQDDHVVWGDQGFANHAFYDLSDFDGNRWQFLHGVTRESYQNALETNDYLGVHFIGDFIVKPYDIPYTEVSRQPYYAFYAAYQAYAFKAQVRVNPDRAYEVFRQLTNFENQIFTGHAPVVEGISLYAELPKGNWREVPGTRKYKRYGVKPRRFLVFPLLEPLSPDKDYEIDLRVSLHNQEDTPVRLLAFNKRRTVFADYGALQVQDDQAGQDIRRIQTRISGTSLINGLGFSSSDFNDDGSLELLEMRFRPVNKKESE